MTDTSEPDPLQLKRARLARAVTRLRTVREMIVANGLENDPEFRGELLGLALQIVQLKAELAETPPPEGEGT